MPYQVCRGCGRRNYYVASPSRCQCGRGATANPAVKPRRTGSQCDSDDPTASVIFGLGAITALGGGSSDSGFSGGGGDFGGGGASGDF